jgi:predicted transcriptional regulator
MKYLLIAILVVSATAQAKPFSQADYAAKTGKLPPAKVAKNTMSFTEKVENTIRSIEKTKAKVEALNNRKNEVYKQFAEALARIGQSTGDTTLARRMAEKDRKSRLFTIEAEIKKAHLKIDSLSEHLAYYRHMVKGEEMAKKLRIGKSVANLS